MAKKTNKEKRPRRIKQDGQIPISQVRPIRFLGLESMLEHARDFPILGCWIMEDWKEMGMTPVIVARLQNAEKVLFCNCMVDVYCLGVKDAFTRTDLSIKSFKKHLSTMCGETPLECTPEFAHQLIYGAIEFAAKYGFQPHRDFTRQMADRVLDPPETYPRKKKIEFGKKGKPLYIAGPNDDKNKIRNIIDTLTRTAGAGKFDYIIGFDPTDKYFAASRKMSQQK
jgi:hypothetical protein